MCTERYAPLATQRGLTLVELIFFIVVVSFGLAGILLVLNQSTSRSADPMVRKQLLAIAEAVMEEVRLQTHGWCDPDDANAATATSAADCAGGTPAEARGSATAPWDQVSDYDGAVITTSLAGTAYPVGFSASVQVTPTMLGSLPNDGSALQIRVTATRGAESIVLEGYRTRYAPNALP
ncbi:MAG: type II secretion system protein [Curvibacter sp.]|jgi:MSHA pilin protein MshD|nr:type II secretion system protein [Curvibacter sp.]